MYGTAFHHSGTAETQGGNRGGDSLVHPVGGGSEPVDDLGVVDGKEGNADESDDERDIVP